MTISSSLTIRKEAFLKEAPWVLRLTEHEDKPAPVMVIKEQRAGRLTGRLTGRFIYGQAMYRRIKPLREMLARVCDADAIPLELHRLLTPKPIVYRGSLPLDDDSGSKIALLFLLQHRMRDLDRIELIAWRIQRFTREEAIYWLSRATQYGDAPNRWAQTGMRIMLGGYQGDDGVDMMLQDFRQQSGRGRRNR